jgi:nucleotide-binding universal stress UspA family protein
MKIMWGYDGSNASRAALQVAIKHAKAFGARLFLVSSMSKGTEDEQKEIRQVEKELEDIKSQVESDGIACETHLLIRGMIPGEDLVNYAEENDIEEIVIGVRRRSKMGKLLFGSTTQVVILSAPCPVVTVR